MGELLFEIFMTALAYSTGVAETIAGTLMNLTRKGIIEMIKELGLVVTGITIGVVGTLYVTKDFLLEGFAHKLSEVVPAQGGGYELRLPPVMVL